MALDFEALLFSLREETETLTSAVTDIAEDKWNLPTPADGWAIRDQISHLAYFDNAAVEAVRFPNRFKERADALMAEGMNFPDRLVADHRSMSTDELSQWFERARGELLEVFSETEPRTRVPWFGPSMSVASSATARLMETWAHGRDVCDALSLPHPPTTGLASIAHLGVSTFAHSYAINNRDVPTQSVRVELEAPVDGTAWAWGPADANNTVRGSAADFALVVTQRRHIDDTSLQTRGDVAREWMCIAQAFAGNPGTRRAPRHRDAAVGPTSNDMSGGPGSSPVSTQSEELT